MFPDASEKNIILGFPQNDYHKYLPGMSRSWWRSLMGHSQQCSTGIDHRTFGNDQKHFFWTLPPFPPLSTECPFSVRKLKSQDQSRLRLHWKLKNPSLKKKVFLRPFMKRLISAQLSHQSKAQTYQQEEMGKSEVTRFTSTFYQPGAVFLGIICFSLCISAILAGHWKWRRIQTVGLTTSICLRAGFVTRLRTIT